MKSLAKTLLTMAALCVVIPAAILALMLLGTPAKHDLYANTDDTNPADIDPVEKPVVEASSNNDVPTYSWCMDPHVGFQKASTESRVPLDATSVADYDAVARALATDTRPPEAEQMTTSSGWYVLYADANTMLLDRDTVQWYHEYAELQFVHTWKLTDTQIDINPCSYAKGRTNREQSTKFDLAASSPDSDKLTLDVPLCGPKSSVNAAPSVIEAADAVSITVYKSGSCPDTARIIEQTQEVDVQLRAPLGSRKVYDGSVYPAVDPEVD